MFCSTMVYATKGAPSECQQYRSEYGGRDLQLYKNMGEEIYSYTRIWGKRSTVIQEYGGRDLQLYTV